MANFNYFPLKGWPGIDFSVYVRVLGGYSGEGSGRRGQPVAFVVGPGRTIPEEDGADGHTMAAHRRGASAGGDGRAGRRGGGRQGGRPRQPARSAAGTPTSLPPTKNDRLPLLFPLAEGGLQARPHCDNSRLYGGIRQPHICCKLTGFEFPHFPASLLHNQ